MSTGDRASRWRRAAACLVGALLGLLMPLAARAQAPPAAPNAGKIATLIPIDSVLRERKALQAAKDMPLFWGDLVKTEKGGRVRVQLNDGSILNIGSQSSVLIQRHDAGAQQTDLQLIYGRMRSDVVKIVQPGGSFNVRTTAAVAGVIGTQEYLEATDILTTVIALGGGNVAVRSTDPRYTETVLLAPGEALTAITAHPLGQKRPATPQELQKAFESTEAGPIATLQAPAQAAPGQTVQTFIAGKGLNTTTAVTSTQPGIQVQISGPVTATQIPVTITVANNVPTGTYPLIVSRPEGILRALLVVSSLAAAGGGGGAGGPIQPPSSQSFSVNQGIKLNLDASSASTPAGTQIVAYQWQVTGTAVPASAATQLTSSQPTFLVDTNLLPLGNYTIQLALVNSSGQSATQQYPLTVVGIPQPQDVIAQVAIGYESLQPAQFLKNFDEQRFANYASFAQAVQDSFTTKLASVRVFQRPATCSIVQEQDTAICQVDFQVQFTLRNEPSVFIDSSGNPVPAGTPGATLGKPIETGTEHATLRFYRSDSGWKIVDYTATVSCPGGGTSSGVNVGSCILAIGSPATPSFSLANLQLPSGSNVTAGSSSPANEGTGAVAGQFDVVPAGGFNGSVTLAAQPSIPGVTVAFSPSGPVSSGTVHFTVSATASVPPIPPDFNGTLPFTVVISGRDSTGTLNSTLSVPLTLRADYTLSATSPVSVAPGGSISIPVQVVPVTSGFNGNVTISLQSPPAGFSATPITVAGGTAGNLVVQVAATVTSGSQPLTLQGTFAAITRTTTATVNVASVVAPFTLTVTSPTTTVNVIPAGTLPVTVQVAPAPGVEFTGPVNISFPTPLFPVINPQPITVPGSATYNVLPDANLRAGPASFIVQGTLGTSTVTATVNVNVLVPFTLSVAPPPNAVPGVTLHLSVTLSPIEGFPTVGIETVTLQNPIPRGFSATPFSITTGSGPQDFQVTVDPSTVPGNYTLNVLATFDNVSQAVSVPVTVVPASLFALQVAPATSASSPVNVIATGTLPVQVSVVPLNGFTGTVTVSVQSNNEFTASPITLAAGSSGTLTVFVSAISGGLGPQQFVVQGTSGSLVQTSTVFVNVLFPFTLNVTPATTQSSPVNEAQGTSFSFSVQVVPVLNFDSSADITFSPPPGIQVNPTGATNVVQGNTVNFSAQVASTAPLGPATIGVVGTLSGSSNATQASVFVNVTGPALFQIQQSTSNTSPLMLAAGSSASLPVSIVLSGSRTLSSARSLKSSATTLASATMQTLSSVSSVALSFGPLPQGVSVQPTTATLVPGGTQTFTFSFTPGTANPSFGSADVTLTALAPGAAPVQTQIVLDLVASPNASFVLTNSTSVGPVVLTLPTPVNPTSFFLNVSPFLNQPVTVSFSQLPAGISVNPATLTSLPTPSEFGNLGPFQFLANPGLAVPGSYTVVATATSGGQTATTTVALQVEGSFSLSVSPSNTSLASPLVLQPGGPGQNVVVAATSLSGFTGPVTVFFSVPLSLGLTRSTVSQTINISSPGGSAQVTFTLVAPTSAGSTQPAAATISATSPNGPALNSLTGPFLAIGGPGFSLSSSTTSVTLVAGGGSDTTMTLQVASVGGFNSPVILTPQAPTAPFNSGLEVNPTQETIQPGGQGQFFLHARGGSNATPGGPFTLNICGVDASHIITASSCIAVAVTIQGQISLNVTDATGGLPGTQTNPIVLAPTQPHSFNVQVGGNNNYSGTTIVTVQNIDPNGLTITFGAGFTPTGPNTATINVPATGTLTLTANSPGLTFNFEQINVQASSPSGLSSTNPSQTIFITGTVTGFILGCDRGDHAVTDCADPRLPPLTLNINQASSTGTLQLRADSVGNLRDPIKVVPVGLPPGVTMSPSSLIITPQNALAGTDTPVTFTAASPATAGPFAFTLQGTDTLNTAIVNTTNVRVTLQGSVQLVQTFPATLTTGTPFGVIPPGGSQNFTVAVTGQNGFCGTATVTATAPFPANISPPSVPAAISCSSPSTAVTATFNVAIPANTPASGFIPINFDASPTPNTYTVPGQTSINVFFAVGPTSFTMQLLGAGATLAQPLTVQAGSQASSSVQIDPVGGFTGTVTLDVIGLPPGFFAQFFAPNSTVFKTRSAATLGPPLMQADYPVTGSSFIAPFQIFAPSGGPAGVAQATLTATSGTIAESMPLVIYVVPQVTLTLNPIANFNTSALIPPGGSIPLQVSIGGAPGFTGAVDLTFQPGTGLTVTPPTARVSIGGSVTITVAAAPSVAPGTQLGVHINASINGFPVTGAFAFFSVATGTFQISVNPASASSPATPLLVQPGGSPVNASVTVNPSGSFTGLVTIVAAFFGDSGFLSTLQASQTVSAGQTATFPVSASANAPPLTATMSFLAVSGSLESSAQILVTTTSGNVVLTPSSSGGTITTSNPLMVDVNGQSPATLSIGIAEQQNFSGPVTLTVTNLPPGVTISPNNVTVAPNISAGCFSLSSSFFPGGLVSCQTFAVTASSLAAPGNTQLTVSASASGIPSPVSTTVPVRIRGNYSLAISPGGSATSPAAVAPGGSSLPITVSVVSQSTFPASSITITPDMKSLPVGVTILPASAAADSSTPARFTLTAAAGVAPTGELTLNFASNTPFFDNSVSPLPIAALFYTVGSAPTFNMTAAPQVGTLLNVLIGDPGGNTEFVTLTPVGGFNSNVNGPVSITVNNLPAGVHANPAATVVNLAGTPVTVPIVFTADSTVLPQFTQAVTITAGTLTQPVSLNLLGDYRLQPQGTGQTQGSGSSASDPVILPPPAAGSPSQSFNFNLFVNAMDNFSGTVNLAATSSLPAGVTASITPTATPTTPGTFTITVPASVTSSPVFPITITATSTTAFTNPQKLTFFFEVASAATPSISLIVPSAPVVVGIGSNQFTTFQIGFTGFVGGSGSSPLNLTLQAIATTVPAGVTFSPAIGQASVHGSLSATGINLQVRADPPASAGPVSITLQATVTAPSATGTPTVVTTGTAVVQLDLQGSYALTTTPATSPTLPGVLAPGQSITYTVNAIGQNGFSSPVTLTLNNQNLGCAPLGSVFLASLCGVSVSPTTLTVTPGTPAQFTVSASASAPAAAITPISFQSNAAHATSSPTLPLYLAVGPTSFTFVTSTFLSNPAGVMINGGRTTVTANFISLGGFSAPATFTVGTLPPGLTVSPQSASGTLSSNNNQNSINFTFQADQRLQQGPLNIPVTLTSNGQSVTGFFYLYIISNLALTQNPATSFSAPLALTPGDTTGQTVTLTLQSQGGVNTGALPLTLSNVAPDLTVAPSSTTLSGGGSVALKVTASANATPGIHSFIASVSFAGLTAQTPLFFFVGTGDFSLVVSPASSTSGPLFLTTGAFMPVGVSVVAQNGFAGQVTITLSIPPGLGVLTVMPSSLAVLPGQTATFTFFFGGSSALPPTQVTFTAVSGTLNHQASAFISGNVVSTFSLSITSNFGFEKGNSALVAENAAVVNTGSSPLTVTLSFGDVPQGVNINPPTQTATVPPGSIANNLPFTAFVDSTAVPGQYVMQFIGTTSTQTQAIAVAVSINPTTSGVFLTTNPATSQAAPLLLQPDATLVSFANINVNAKGGFAGPVSLAASNVPPGVTATLVPASADLTSTPLQVVQLQLRTTTGLAAFGPMDITVSTTNLTTNASAEVFVALQTVSSVTKIGNTGSRTAPQVTSALPASGIPGSYTTVMVQGKALSGITSVLADSPFISGKLEPGATDQRLTISVFVSRGARRGEHALMLVGPNGSLPLAFQVVTPVVEKVNNDGVLGRRLRLPSARNNSGLDDDISNPASTTTSVASVTPTQLQLGATTDASLVGANLAQTTAVRVSGTGIRAEILRASDSEVRVRFTIDAAALPGSRIVTVQAGTQTATTLADIAATAPVVAPAPRQDHARLTPANDDSAAPVAAPAVPQLQVSDIAMTPSHPRLSDTVTFSVQVTNEGSTRSSGVPVEFSIAGTNARTRQLLTLEAGQNQRLEFEWRATQAGRFAPKVVLDPDGTIAGLDRSQAVSALPAFELAGAEAPAAPLRQLPSFRERTRLTLALGGCTGLRLVSGSETSCNGAADVSIRLASVAAGLRIEADGVRNLGTVPLEQVNSAPAGSLASSDTLLAGYTYLVQAGRQTVVLRVVAIRGLESLRNAPPAPLRAPRLDGSGGFGRSPIATGEVTVMLEWKEFPQR